MSSSTGLLRLMQLIALPPICVFLLQVTLAWSGPPYQLKWRYMVTPLHKWLALVLLALLMGAAWLVCLDPFIKQSLPGYFPDSWLKLLTTLPWTALFQPLFLVSATYAFALRIGGKPTVAMVAVVLCHQVIPLLQFQETIASSELAVFLLMSGFHGLVLCCAYRIYGLPGPVILVVVSQLRHVSRLI